MNNSNLEIREKIKKEFLLSNKRRNIKIPSGINFNIENDSVIMRLSSNAVSSNMQKDDGAFEGWALVLRRWGKYNNVIISWDKPNSIDNRHYQRFLFRLKHFSQDFNAWFLIDKDCQQNLRDLKINTAEKYLLNIPSKRSDKVSPKPEAVLENRFVNSDLREPLMNISNASSIFRQLPVGVFENKVSKSASIFTYGKSAIDIWGFNKFNELLVFELKADSNEKVGIISELYFYVCVLQMVRKRIFKHENCLIENKHLLEIPKTKKINAYILSPTLHPLVDKKILNLLNEVNPDEISYHYIQFNKDLKLTLDVFN
ncbi:MAG TPA: hypothetical protein DEO54_05445 [Rikenellaceae bacterium]|nr:MAG: hypothetical protein A2X20_01280 [Bacteroidetes bacterium GWE2_40_15]HBZ25671.1 hypothetical protein [Rikenellaceae bacterium]